MRCTSLLWTLVSLVGCGVAAACGGGGDSTSAAVEPGPASAGSSNGESTDPNHAPPRPQGLPVCPSPKWCWENPFPQGSTLEAVHGTAPDDVWAVGEGGVVLWWGGEAWTSTPSGTTSSLRSVWAAARNDVWIAGDQGTLLHWDGTRLVPTKVTDLSIAAVSGSAPNDVWAVANGPNAKATLLHWDGRAWSSTPTPYASLRTLWVRAADDAWASGNSDGVLGSVLVLRYDGSSWKPVAVPSDRSFEPDVTGFWGTGSASASGMWMVAEGINFSTLAKLDGEAWKSKYTTPASSFSLSALWGASDSDLWAVGGSKIVHWDGAEFRPTPNVISSRAIWGSGASDIWQVGDDGGIARSDGKKWSAVSRGIIGGGAAIMGSGQDDVWNVGAEGVMHYDGKQWNDAGVPGAGGAWVNLSVASKTSAWMLGSTGAVAHWNGTSWSVLSKNAFLRGGTGSIWASAENDVWVSASNDTMQRWDGSKWNTVSIYNDCGNGGGSGLWGASPTDLWLAGADGVMHVTGGNVSTNPAYEERRCARDKTVTGVSSVWGRAADDVWAYGSEGTIHHYDGKTWKNTPSGVKTTISSLWASSRDDAWATGTDVSTGTSDLLHWDGKAWSKVEGVAGFTAVWGADAKNVWTVARGGRVLRFKP